MQHLWSTSQKKEVVKQYRYFTCTFGGIEPYQYLKLLLRLALDDTYETTQSLKKNCLLQVYYTVNK